MRDVGHTAQPRIHMGMLNSIHTDYACSARTFTYARVYARTHARTRTYSTCTHMRTHAPTHARTHTHTRAIYIIISLYIYISTRTHYRIRAYIHTPHTRNADTHLTHITLMHSYEDALMCMYYVATLGFERG